MLESGSIITKFDIKTPLCLSEENLIKHSGTYFQAIMIMMHSYRTYNAQFTGSTTQKENMIINYYFIW